MLLRCSSASINALLLEWFLLGDHWEKQPSWMSSMSLRCRRLNCLEKLYMLKENVMCLVGSLVETLSSFSALKGMCPKNLRSYIFRTGSNIFSLAVWQFDSLSDFSVPVQSSLLFLIRFNSLQWTGLFCRPAHRPGHSENRSNQDIPLIE